MKKGQILLLFAFFLPIVLMLLAAVIELGRVWVYRVRLQRGAQAAVDAGISAAAEQIATLAIAAQTRTACPTMSSTCPERGDLASWLDNAARATLTASDMQATVLAVAEDICELNQLSSGEAGIGSLLWTYPQVDFRPDDDSVTSLRLSLTMKGRVDILLGGWLGMEEVVVPVNAAAEIPCRR